MIVDQKAVALEGFNKFDWDRSFHDFIAGEFNDFTAVSEPSSGDGVTEMGSC